MRKLILKIIGQIIFVIIFFSTLEAKNLNIFNQADHVSDYFSGILLLITAFSSTGNISQSGTFKLGAFVVFAMGIVTYLYIQEIITKSQHIIILVVMLLSCLTLSYTTYYSVNNTILNIKLKKEVDNQEFRDWISTFDKSGNVKDQKKIAVEPVSDIFLKLAFYLLSTSSFASL